MQLTLLLPGLLWPGEIMRDTVFDLTLPALSWLIGRGRRTAIADIDGWLAARVGLPTPLPMAALRLLGDGGMPGDSHWLCLDPIHLRVEERALMIDATEQLALRPDEDSALRAAVAELFEGELLAPVAGRWYLRAPAEIDSPPLPLAVGKPLSPVLPGGGDGARWRRLLAEVQPLLHAHAVNRARDAAGQPTVNSLWPWGGGRLPSGAQQAFDQVWTNDPMLAGLGRLTGADIRTCPARFVPTEGRVLVHLDPLVAPTAGFDALAWRDALATLEKTWFAPLLADLRARRCRRLTLLADGPAGAVEVTLGGADVIRFWRRPMPLTELAP